MVLRQYIAQSGTWKASDPESDPTDILSILVLVLINIVQTEYSTHHLQHFIHSGDPSSKAFLYFSALSVSPGFRHLSTGQCLKTWVHQTVRSIELNIIGIVLLAVQYKIVRSMVNANAGPFFALSIPVSKIGITASFQSRYRRIIHPICPSAAG